MAIAPSSLSKRIKKYPLVKSVVETKEEGKWSFKHSWRALNEALPPKVRPMTVLRAFLAAAPCISKTNSEGKSAFKTKLGSTGDGPWGLAPVGMIDLGPLLRCAWVEQSFEEWPKRFPAVFLEEISHLGLVFWFGALLLLSAFRRQLPGLPSSDLFSSQ